MEFYFIHKRKKEIKVMTEKSRSPLVTISLSKSVFAEGSCPYTSLHRERGKDGKMEERKERNDVMSNVVRLFSSNFHRILHFVGIKRPIN